MLYASSHLDMKKRHFMFGFYFIFIVCCSEFGLHNLWPFNSGFLKLNVFSVAGSNFELEQETREYVNSIPIEEDTPVDKYSLPDEEQHEEPHVETIVEEAPVEQPAPLESAVNHMNYVEDPISAPADEPVGEPPKLSYASIVCLLLYVASHLYYVI